MEQIKTAEKQIHQAMDQYVKLVDDFETALNKRTSVWHDRAVRAKNRSTSGKNLFTVVISLAIAAAAIYVGYICLFKG